MKAPVPGIFGDFFGSRQAGIHTEDHFVSGFNSSFNLLIDALVI